MSGASSGWRAISASAPFFLPLPPLAAANLVRDLPASPSDSLVPQNGNHVLLHIALSRMVLLMLPTRHSESAASRRARSGSRSAGKKASAMALWPKAAAPRDTRLAMSASVAARERDSGGVVAMPLALAFYRLDGMVGPMLFLANRHVKSQQCLRKRSLGITRPPSVVFCSICEGNPCCPPELFYMSGPPTAVAPHTLPRIIHGKPAYEEAVASFPSGSKMAHGTHFPRDPQSSSGLPSPRSIASPSCVPCLVVAQRIKHVRVAHHHRCVNTPVFIQPLSSSILHPFRQSPCDCHKHYTVARRWFSATPG